MTKPVILCVDDEHIILDSLKKQLMHGLGSQYRIELAESGEEALEVIEELVDEGIEIPIVISDELMKGMYGHELLSHTSKLSPDTLAILLTGQATTDAIGEAINQAGLYRYFAKPWDGNDLVLTVETGLRSYFHKKELDYQNLRNRVLNEISSQALKRQPLAQQLDSALRILLSHGIFESEGGGAIFLEANEDIPNPIQIRSGEHTHPPPDISARELSNEILQTEDGWFIAPIFSDQKAIGSLMVLTKREAQRSDQSRLFLSSISNTLSGMIRLACYQDTIERHNELLEEQVSQRTQELNGALKKQAQLNDILLLANEKLDVLAGTDDLTKLLNRRSFFDKANLEAQRRQRYAQEIAVIVLDVDRFKEVNDSLGHHIGDQVLVKLSEALQSLVRKQDIVGRFGGDEFAIILPETPSIEAERLGDRIRQEVAQNPIVTQGGTFTISISLGLTSVEDNENSIFPAMIRADKALYQSKSLGRNRITLYTD